MKFYNHEYKPARPATTKATKKPNSKDEQTLQSKCYRWFKNTYPQEYGRMWMQYNNPKSQQTGFYLKAQGMVAGVSDLAFIRKDGKMIFIEMKTETGRVSDEQKWWQSVVTGCEAEYHIIRTFEAFQELIKKHI
jgi:hypothetical protein